MAKKRKGNSSEQNNPDNKDSSDSHHVTVAKYTLISAVVVALISLIGVIVKGVLELSSNREIVSWSMNATSTAEVKLTTIATLFTPTATVEPFTSTSTSSVTHTSIPTTTPSPSLTPTMTLPPFSFCQDNGMGGVETVPVNPPRSVKGIIIDLKTRRSFENGEKYGFSLWEVVIYSHDTASNLAIGATSYASSEQDTKECIKCLAIKAIDGDISSRWSSEFYEPQWLRVDFSTPQVIQSIVLKWQDAYAEAYCITEIK